MRIGAAAGSKYHISNKYLLIRALVLFLPVKVTVTLSLASQLPRTGKPVTLVRRWLNKLMHTSSVMNTNVLVYFI